MKSQLQTRHKQSLSKKVMLGFVSAISRLIIKFNINLSDFFELIKIETVRLTYKKNNKIYETALLTGLDHRVVSNIVNSNYTNINNKSSMMEMLILQEIHKSSKHCKDQMIPKKGDLNSLTTILKKHGYSYVRLRTVIDVLVARGVIEEYENHVKYLGLKYKNKQSDEDYFQNIARSFNRYSNTVIFNRDDLLKSGQGLYERTVFSTQINPRYFNEIESNIFQMCRDFNEHVGKYLESYETHSPDTYDEIGVSIFQVNSSKRNNNE
jgi:hypothetical protein